MKNIISKYGKYGLILALPVMMSACADDNNFWDYFVDRPGSEAEYDYLKDYDALKTYVDRTSHPDFKLSCALGATDYINGTETYAVATSNFDEIVAGNAMKMSSCVSDKGVMDFTTVTDFVNKADDAGQSVYGHVLAWHSQQPIKWLSSLIADQEIDTDAKVVKTDAEIDLGSISSLDGWGSTDALSRLQFKQDGAMLYHSTAATTNFWDAQYMLKQGMALTVGNTYKCVFVVKAVGGGDATIHTKLGDWSGGDTKNFTVPSDGDYHEITVSYSASVASNFMLVQTGEYVGDIYWKSFTVTHEEKAEVEVEKDAFNQTYTDGPFPYYQMGCAPPIVDGSIHFVGTGAWSQFFCSTANSLTAGTYRAYVTCNGTTGGSFNFVIQNGWASTSEKVTKTLSVKEGWTTAKIDFELEQGGSYDIIVQPGTYTGTFDLKSIDVKSVVKMNKRPLTDQEKKDTLTYAMTTWCNNMMNATSGKVRAWDMINEAIGGNSNFTVDGFYQLQGSKNGNTDSWEVGGDKFYWQDFLGSEDYGPIVEKAARDAYKAATDGDGSELQLFVNDYNLESDWDNNAKVKSLVYWVNKWEKRGKELGYNTKIDGLGTQMHISYYENETTQASKKQAIQNMFKIMADARDINGNPYLVRVSELDMGYVCHTEKKDSALTTAQIDALPDAERLAKKKAMADFYQWIIEQYFEIVPAAQQYGICQWCLTDSPAGSSWRAGQPVGIWTEEYKRKPAYGGWAEGLKK